MNPILRQRIPACVRTLLTDIGPKDEHIYHTAADDDETETVTLDGVELPGRGVEDPGELLSPAGLGEKGGKGLKKETRVCGLCFSKPPCYTCPRCNVPYCGLACYRGSAHSTCSEEFYKESVIQELSGMGESEEAGKKRMQEILVKLSKEGERKEGGIAEVLREMEEGDGEMEEEGEEEMLGNQQILVLLSRLAEIQSSGGGDSKEIEDILTKLKEIGEEGGERGKIDETVARLREAEEGEEEEEQDLAERFSGLDIDSLSEEQLWELLPQQDKDRFEGLLKGGAIGGLVPLWSPWWEKHEDALIELLEGDEDGEEQKIGEEGGLSRLREAAETAEGDGKEDKGILTERNKKRKKEEEKESKHTCGKDNSGKFRKDGTEAATVVHGTHEDERKEKQGERKGMCEKEDKSQMHRGQRRRSPQRTGNKRKSQGSMVPQVNKKIPSLNSLSAQTSPLVRYSLVNALYGYTFSMSLFNGELSEPDMVQEFCRLVLAISESLSSSKVFGSLQEALEAGASTVGREHFDRGDPGAQARAVEAVAHVLSGKSRHDEVGYTLAALSQLQAVLNQAKGALSKDDGAKEIRRKYFLAGKKCEFLQSWVKDNGPAVRLLAGGVWREHRRKEKERKGLDKEKKKVEEIWKKGRGRGKGRLIEEID